MPDRPDHPDREQLAAFQAGDGERRQRSEVEAHLAGCPSCAEVVASVARARSGLALLEEPALPAGLHDRVAAAVEAEAAAGLSAGRGRGQAAPEALRPTPWYRRPVAWGAAAALLLAALVVPFLDQSDTTTYANRDTAGAGAAQEAGTEAAGGGTTPLPIIRIPGEVTAAKVAASLAADRRAKAALDAAAPGATGPRVAAPGDSLAQGYGQTEGTGPSAPARQADAALLATCLPAATGATDPAARPLTPAFFVEGTYQGREATILVTTSASPPGRVDLWVFPRNDCSAPPLTTERVR